MNELCSFQTAFFQLVHAIVHSHDDNNTDEAETAPGPIDDFFIPAAIPADEPSITAVHDAFTTEQQNPFTDVGENWYYPAVMFVAQKGLMNGTGVNTFSPYMNLSRSMMAQIFYNLENKPQVTAEIMFTDVNPEAWYYDAVMWAAANNIVTGSEVFLPDESITRENLGVILYNYAKRLGVHAFTNLYITGYTDTADIAENAMDAMIWANENRLIVGRSSTALVPQGITTRAEAAALFQRFLEKYAKGDAVY